MGYSLKIQAKTLPIFVPTAAAKGEVEKAGFRRVTVRDQPRKVNGVTVTSTRSQHGSDRFMETPPYNVFCAGTSGYFFEAAGCPSVYLAGDTVWKSFVSEVIREKHPAAVILNTGNAIVTDFPESIIMGARDFERAYREAPWATVIAVHMDAINHRVLHRKDLRDFAERHGLDAERARVPDDGKIITVG